MSEVGDRLRAIADIDEARRALVSTDDLRAAADEIERLQSLLDGRDKFIVDNDLWAEFVETLRKPSGDP